MGMFNFSVEEILCFFAVMVRYSVLVAVLPFVGDKFIPVPAKVLIAVAFTIALYPALVSRGFIKPGEAIVWGSTTWGIVSTIGLEAIFGLVLGFVARMLFDAIHFGANLTGNFMGFAAASTYDPHQESQTHVVAEIQLAFAMLIFLTLDGHHLMLKASLGSYEIVGLGKAGFGEIFSKKLIELSGQVIRFGIQIASPVAIALFAVNIAFGVVAKAMPQLNILVLSFAVSALVGLIVLFLSIPEFQLVTGNILGKMDEWMRMMMYAMVAH